MEKQDPSGNNGISRRQFLGATAAAAAFIIVPRHVLGGPGYKPPSDTLNIACIGVGGKGTSDIAAVAHENIVALCDVDERIMAKFLKAYPERVEPVTTERFRDAMKYRDFRRMLELEKGIDAVTVSTPDHTHAAAAMAAIQLGKHVFVQKPLTHSIFEARTLAKAAADAGIVSQMGNQGHSWEGTRLLVEWIRDGAIGPVREVHVWTNRPIWPQGIDRPKETPPVPPKFHWDLWLGPAPYRPYHPAYAPFKWRGWRDFGTGALGDMGAHLMDQPFWALDLGYPEWVEGTSTPFNSETWPESSVIRYQFPARGEQPPVQLTWYDGGNMPPRPEQMEPGRRMGDSSGGVLFIGDKGVLMCGTYGRNPRLVPETAMRAYKRPPKTLPRSPGIHQEWIDAIKNGGKSSTDFSYSARLTEVMLLGNVALAVQEKHSKIYYDAEKMEITNVPEANALLKSEYREGWTL